MGDLPLFITISILPHRFIAADRAKKVFSGLLALPTLSNYGAALLSLQPRPRTKDHGRTVGSCVVCQQMSSDNYSPTCVESFHDEDRLSSQFFSRDGSALTISCSHQTMAILEIVGVWWHHWWPHWWHRHVKPRAPFLNGRGGREGEKARRPEGEQAIGWRMPASCRCRCRCRCRGGQLTRHGIPSHV